MFLMSPALAGRFFTTSATREACSFLLGSLNMWASLVVQIVKNLLIMQEARVRSLVKKIPRRRAWQPTPVFLPGESHGQRSLVGDIPCSHRESDITEVT